jgi:hypothetical protein
VKGPASRALHIHQAAALLDFINLAPTSIL